MPKFSVLMSVYCKEVSTYLDESLRSLSVQSCKPDEIVMVIDGYIPHELLTVIEYWKALLPMKIIPLSKNVGLGNALNIGLQHVTYDLVARMDTDDVCTPDRFYKQIDYFKKKPETIILGSAIEEYDSNFNIRIGRRFSCSKNQEIINYALMRNPFNHMTVMFNKTFIMDIGGYQHHLYMEDYNLWLRCIASGGVFHNLEDSLVHVRAGDNMIKRRRGWRYANSELKLIPLKWNCFPDKKMKILLMSLGRFLVRLLPESILSTIYKKLRY